jgi:polar amino acid transport system substrate-binding protein
LQNGACDALVHDSTVLQALVRLPEWKAFNNSFAVGEPRQLAVVLPASNRAAIAQVRQAARDWQASAHSDQLAATLASRLSEEVRRNQQLATAY